MYISDLNHTYENAMMSVQGIKYERMVLGNRRNGVILWQESALLGSL